MMFFILRMLLMRGEQGHLPRNMVKIVQINLGKRPLAAEGLKSLISTDKYEIALIQEPYTYKGKVGKLGYDGNIYNSGNNGDTRACIWINKDLDSESEAIHLVEFSDKDCVAVKLTIKEIDMNREIILCSAYFPGINEAGRNVISEKLNNLVTHCLSKRIELIVGCDANAHNLIWRSNNDCTRGKILLEYLMIKELHLLNEGDSPTWERGGSTDVIDITFATRIISRNVSNWKVLNRSSLSDHNYISMEIYTRDTTRQKFRNKKKTNWDGYLKSLERFLQTPLGNIQHKADLDREAEFLTKAIVESY